MFADASSTELPGTAKAAGEDSFEAAVARWAAVLAQGGRNHD